MEVHGMAADEARRYVISRSWRTIETVPRVLSQAKERINVWRRAARLGVRTIDRRGEVLEGAKRTLEVVGKVIYSTAPHREVIRKMIQSLGKIYY
jgi:tRNA G37 N-methylase TrmD